MRSGSLRNKETSWHVWYDPAMWTLSGFELQDLGAGRSRRAQKRPRDRHVAILNLCYHDGTQMRVMFMKNLKGTAAADSTLQLDLRKRGAILETVFEFLCLPFTGATMVVGDLGVGLPTLHDHMRLQGIVDSVQAHCNKSQTFHALFRAPNNAMTSTIDTGSQRMMLHQISTHCSRDLHPAAEAEAPQTEPSSSSRDLHPVAEAEAPQTEPTSSRDLHPAAEAGASAKLIHLKTWKVDQIFYCLCGT